MLNGKKNGTGSLPTLKPLLKYMVEHDGLADAVVPFFRRYGGSVIDILFENSDSRERRKGTDIKTPPTLAGIRNSLAHGDPFDGLPWAGLLELVRDLIEYAFRGYLQEGGCETLAQ
jgi:hypothetical protein